MKANEKGFLYPEIDKEKCIRCKKCVSVCPVNEKNGNEAAKVGYAFKRRDDAKRMESQSGGAFSVFAEESNDNKARGFLAEYGWKTGDECIDKSVIIVPEPFDLVYENYNALQQGQGLDLTDYKGKEAIRYTYNVKNSTSDDVRCNVIVCENKVIAGDLCTTALDGAMTSLVDNRLKQG